MKRILLATGAMIGAGMVFATPASAQATRTWVSGVGDDANPCSRTAPCKTFASAISKTATGGEINCLDPAGYSTLTITKSISIVCDTTLGGIVAAGTNGIIINGPGIKVVLSGLDIDGIGNGNSPGVNGIRFLDGASLVLDNVKIRGFRNGYGVDFEPASGTAALTIRNSIVSDSGLSGNATTGGILVKPSSSASALVSITDSSVANNLNVGIRFDAVTPANTVVASVSNTSVVNSGTGLLFRALNGQGTIDATVNGATVVQNANYGIIATGINATARIGDSTIANNNVGLLVNGAAPLSSFGDNRLAGNATNGAFPTITAKQ